MSFPLISQNPGFDDQIKLSLDFHRHCYRSTYLQYYIVETFFSLPRSAVLHRIDFFHLDGLRESGLKEHFPHRTSNFL